MAATVVNHQVSPTVLSSDLFTPLREPRVTLPTIGVHARESPPTGPHPWGGPLTTYGGTGGLPFLGTCRTRDLPFGRSHRHFGSGLSYHPATSQPYRLTALKLSDCRINDQRLTTSLKAEGLRTKWQREAWPGHEPYFSHRSIFDVFPNGEFSEEKATSLTSAGQSAMSEKTRSALMGVRDRLYQKTLYRDSYGNQGDISKPDIERGTFIEDSNKQSVFPVYTGYTYRDWIPVYGSLRHPLPASSNINDDEEQQNEEEEKEKGKNEEIIDNDSKNRNKQYGCRDEEDTVSSLIDQLFYDRASLCHLTPGYTNEGNVDIPKYVPSPPPPPPPPLPTHHSQISPRATNQTNKLNSTTVKSMKPANPTPVREIHEVEQLLPKPDTELVRSGLTFDLGDPVSGVGPCWPPSTSHVMDKIRGTQLLERRDISDFPEAYFSTLQPRYIVPQLPAVCYRLPDSADDKRDAYDRYGVKDGHRILRMADNRSSQMTDAQYLSEQKRLQSNLARTGKGGGAMLFLPPVPLSECLTPSGTNVPHRLGLRFKTEAQRRFHIVHSEEVPDLRSTTSFGKKYFFFDYHSSALRG